MRDFLDFLARWVEPYVSYRWVIAMIFGAMLVSDLLGTWLWLRDISKAAPDATPREQQLRRIARAAIGTHLLRLFSWDSLLRQRGVFTSVVLLLLLAIALNAFVFFA